MGKQLKTKYTNINHRILKKSTKKGKSFVKYRNEYGRLRKRTEYFPKKHISQRKRKILGINENNLLPPNKIMRLSTDNSQSKYQTPMKKEFEEQRIDPIVQNKICAGKCTTSGAVYLKIEDDKSDLFLDDEHRNSHINFIYTDFYFHIRDEICLEGLDGITTEAFWTRFAVLLKGISSINQFMKEQIWKIIMSNQKDMRFFELPIPRGKLEIYNRFDYYNWDIGMIMELGYKLPDIYPHSLVNNSDVQGSCATFNNRVDISNTILNSSLKDIEEKYGNKLAIVASQKSRKLALTTEIPDPLIEMSNMEYCLLERIGRSRRLGESAQGDMSISSALNMDAKSIFHYRQQLCRNGFISKQFLRMKSPITDQNKSGKLIHLRRFFTLIKSRYLMIAGKAINIMRQQPGYRIEITKLKEFFSQEGDIVSKIFKNAEFRKYVKTDIAYPYRFVYPNSSKKEYTRKSGIGERTVRCYELKNPHVNINASWIDDPEESDDDENESEEEGVLGSKFYNMESFRQLYHHIYSKGSPGCSVFELNKMLGLDRNSCRMGVKKLTVKGVVDFEKVDVGRQRLIVYKAKYLKNGGPAAPTEPVVTSTTQSPSGIKARIIEKQRLALSKTKQHKTQVQKTHKKNTISKTLPKVIEMETQQIPTCFFVVQNYSHSCSSNNKELQFLNFSYRFPKHTINLTYKPFFVDSFNINSLLSKIKISQTVVGVKINLEKHFSKAFKADPITKLILLKAHMGEININGTTCSNTNPSSSPRRVPSTNHKQATNVNEILGNDSVMVWKEKEKEVITEILMSAPKQAIQELDFISERVSFRTKIILDVVNESKVVEEQSKLLRIIQDEEAKTGYEEKMDKKSLMRILKRTTEAGHTKIFKILIRDDNVSKSLTFICHPSVDHNDDRIRNACQQLKWKHFISSATRTTIPNKALVQNKVNNKAKSTSSPFSERDVMNSIDELNRLEKTKMIDVRSIYNKNAGKTNGHKPKFIRMRIVHELLFYLLYEQDRNAKIVSKEEVGQMFSSYGIAISDTELQELPTLYCKEISWKMFIPPLPFHVSWPEGWALMCDVIMRLPVSVLCNIHSVAFNSPELNDALRHPIKRFYLIKDNPGVVQTVCLYKRRYLSSIHETISRLALCGLVQYGPQKYKGKDQVFIYLNRLSSLLDTSTSKPSYNKVENKEYPKLSFIFNNPSDVDSYWFNLHGISLNTKLNSRQEGQLVVLMDPSVKPELVETLRSKSCEEALALDNGEQPGDHRGAAGLDSCMWSHIKRNWFWARKSSIEDASVGLRGDRIDEVLPQIPFNSLVLHRSNKIYLCHPTTTSVAKKTKTTKIKLPGPTKPSKKVSLLKKITSRKRLTVAREYFDNVDKNILKKIGQNRRMRWSEEEDNVLLFAKVADLFLQDNKYNRQLVPYTVVRDLLHRFCPESRFKTSRAVQRRLKTITKESFKPLSEVYTNLMQLQPIYKYYSILVNRLQESFNGSGSFRFNEKHITNVYIILMSYILRNQDEVMTALEGSGNSIETDHLSDQNLKYTEKDLVEVEESAIKFRDAATEDDIKKDALKAVIHSSVACQENSTTGLSLLKVYQKYPDFLIRDAVNDLRKTNTITYNKFSSKKDKLWQGPYHLSQLYIFYQFTTHNVTTAVETYKTFSAILPESKFRDFLDFSELGVLKKRYGQMIGVNEFFSFWDRVTFRFDLPQHMIILNPAVEDHGEVINELATRYQIRLRKMQQENNDNEQDMETDEASSEESKEDTEIQPTDSDDVQIDVLDLTVDTENDETINRLRTWVTDCVNGDQWRRSPSPDFQAAEIKSEEMELDEVVADGVVGSHERYENPKRRYSRDHVLTLEEIKEEMLRENVPNEDRIVPYITELSDLLNNKDINTNTKVDEETLLRLKDHFVTQYARLQDIDMEDLDLSTDHHILCHVEDTIAKKNIWENVQRDISISMWVSLESVPNLLIDMGGKRDDLDSMLAIVDFVEKKGFLGATGQQLKDRFPDSDKRKLTLHDIMKVLVNSGVFLQAGISEIHFVHYRHRDSWLIEINNPSEEHSAIENLSEQNKVLKLRMRPWHKINGELNKEFFKTWVCCILSCCIDSPSITFPKLCEKFVYLKPVDIYYLLMILQDLGSIEIMCYEHIEEYFFTEWKETKQRPATFLDNLKDMAITPTNISLTCLGSFLYCDLKLTI